MTSHLGVGFKTRPTLLGLQGTNAARIGIIVRWIGWLAAGWKPTAAAFGLITVAVLVVTWPIILIATIVLVVSTIDGRPIIGLLVMTASMVVAGWLTWTNIDQSGQIAIVGLLAVWPVDALVGFSNHSYRMRRLWAELRRGFPVRFSILALKSTRIQGPMDGEQQLAVGARPILDHPALGRAVFKGDTVWCRCSVSPGRRHEAVREILGELASSFVHVQRIDLVAADDHQSFGHLAVRFGPPLFSADAPPLPAQRLRQFAYQAPAHIGVGAAVVAATWTTIT